MAGGTLRAGGKLIDVVGERSLPAPDMLETLLKFIRPLEEHDEWNVVSHLVQQIVQRGTGAARQRCALERGQRLDDVVDFVVNAKKSPAAA